jgi:hypothetical protein
MLSKVEIIFSAESLQIQAKTKNYFKFNWERERGKRRGG